MSASVDNEQLRGSHQRAKLLAAHRLNGTSGDFHGVIKTSAKVFITLPKLPVRADEHRSARYVRVLAYAGLEAGHATEPSESPLRRYRRASTTFTGDARQA